MTYTPLLRCFPSASIRVHLRLAFFCGFIASTTPILAGGDIDPRVPPEIAALDRDTQAAWRSFSTRFSGHGAAFDGVYYILYDYDRRYDSSARLAATQIERDLTHTVQRGLRTTEIKPAQAEVDAACQLLPAMEVGSYGRVHRVTVREVLGPGSMVASNLELVDRRAVDDGYRDLRRRAGTANREAVEWMFSVRKAAVERQTDALYRERFRLVGYATERVREDEAWAGPEDEPLRLAVVGVEPADAEGADTPRRLLAPLGAFRFGLDQRQLIDLLAQRGVSPAQFVERVREARREFGRDGDLRVARDLMNTPATPRVELLAAETQPAAAESAASKP